MYVDFVGPFMGQQFLIMVDKWPEVIPIKVTSAEKTVMEMIHFDPSSS